MSSASPSRITRTLASSVIRFSASKALALRPSIATVMAMESDIAANIPAHSIRSASPPLRPRAIFTPSVISAAAISMIIIGSRAASAILLNIETGFFLVKLFSPYRRRFCAASSVLSPRRGSTPSLFSVSAALSRKASRRAGYFSFNCIPSSTSFRLLQRKDPGISSAGALPEP